MIIMEMVKDKLKEIMNCKMINLMKFASIAFAILSAFPVLASAEDSNLIANPGFESGSTSPLNWAFVTSSGNAPVWDTVSHTGARSIKISISGTVDKVSGYPQSELIEAQPLATYTFSAWVKTQNAGGSNNPAVRVVELDANNRWLRSTTLMFSKGTNDWTQKQTTFKTGSDTVYLYIYAYIWNGYGTMWLDDVKLSTGAASAPSATSAPIPSFTAAPTPTPAPSPSSPIIAVPASTTGVTYYVAKSGNDNNPGTKEKPWLTIQKAANTAVAGNTVYVMEGTYKERVNVKNSGSSGKWITFAAYPGHKVTIDGNGVPVGAWQGLFYISGKSYIKISGFRVINSAFMGFTVVKSDLAKSSNIIIEKNYVENTASSGIYVSDSNNIIIDGNEINRAQTMNGLSQQTAETLTLVNVDAFEVKNNYIHDSCMENIIAKSGSSNGNIYNNRVQGNNICGLWGIYVDAWGGNSHDVNIFNNVVYNGERASSNGIGVAVENGGSLNKIKIYNNVIYNRGGSGITIAWYSNGPISDVTIIGNTIYGNGKVSTSAGGIDIGKGSNIVVRNNIVSQNNKYQIRNTVGSTTIDHNLIDGYRSYSSETRGTDSIEASPQFVNLAGANFHLKSTSPAIDKGSSISAPKVDFDGNSRPKGTGYDIGAFEYVQ